MPALKRGQRVWLITRKLGRFTSEEKEATWESALYETKVAQKVPRGAESVRLRMQLHAAELFGLQKEEEFPRWRVLSSLPEKKQGYAVGDHVWAREVLEGDVTLWFHGLVEEVLPDGACTLSWPGLAGIPGEQRKLVDMRPFPDYKEIVTFSPISPTRVVVSRQGEPGSSLALYEQVPAGAPEPDEVDWRWVRVKKDGAWHGALLFGKVGDQALVCRADQQHEELVPIADVQEDAPDCPFEQQKRAIPWLYSEQQEVDVFNWQAKAFLPGTVQALRDVKGQYVVKMDGGEELVASFWQMREQQPRPEPASQQEAEASDALLLLKSPSVEVIEEEKEAPAVKPKRAKTTKRKASSSAAKPAKAATRATRKRKASASAPAAPEPEEKQDESKTKRKRSKRKRDGCPEDRWTLIEGLQFMLQQSSQRISRYHEEQLASLFDLFYDFHSKQVEARRGGDEHPYDGMDLAAFLERTK